MSATALVWVLLAVAQFILGFRRPVWAVGLYMQTFFAAPQLWWWGDEIPEARYALWAGIALALVTLLHLGTEPAKTADSSTEEQPRAGLSGSGIAIAMALNATFVQYFIASRPNITVTDYTEFLKYIALFFLLCQAIRTRSDFRVAALAIALGSAYIGYEVTINERGDFNGSRLEGVGAPSADTANGLACLMLTILPIIGSLFIGGTWFVRAIVLVSAPLTLNVLLMCNSRGAFLGLVTGGVAFVMLARGATRKKAVRTILLGATALYLLLGDPRILERFSTTFVGSAERDASASNRLVFWNAALQMLNDYPIGDGGGAFKKVHATRYLREVGSDEEARSIHNGFLTDATDWGVQGITLKLLFLGIVVRAAYRTSKRSRLDGRIDDSLVGLALIVALVGFLTASIFGSYLNNEWCFWLAAFMTRYAALYAVPEAASSTSATAPVAAHIPKFEPASAAFSPSRP